MKKISDLLKNISKKVKREWQLELMMKRKILMNGRKKIHKPIIQSKKAKRSN
jgi:hypothetical protein